jgi:ribose transport system permease protein
MNANLATLRSRASTSGAAEAVREYAIVVCFLALFLTLTFTANQFLTRVNLLNNLESGAIYGIVACALTLLLIVGEFDLSVGAIYVLAGIIAAKLEPSLGVWPALAVGALAGVGIGLLNGVAVAFFRVNSFIATLATSLMIVGLGTKITNGFQLYISKPEFAVLGNSKGLGVDYFIWIFLGFALVCGFVLSRTKLGRWLYATWPASSSSRAPGRPSPATGSPTSCSRRSPPSSWAGRASRAAGAPSGGRCSACSSSSSSATASTCSR